jgi:hypothetical protein
MSDSDLEHRSPGSERTEDTEPEFSIARSNAIIPLLVVFAVVVLGIFVMVTRTKLVIPPVGAAADKAFGPADFPTVFGDEQTLLAVDRGAIDSPDIAFPVPAPPFTPGVFPCMQCHKLIPPNPERRDLAMHSDIVFRHDTEHRWCLDCHDVNDRDQLRLANGTIYRDWREGIHGKRTGFWDGPKRYLLCVHCHNPHSPRFAALRPLPPPVRPQFLRPEDAEANILAEKTRPKAPDDHREHSNAGHPD